MATLICCAVLVFNGCTGKDGAPGATGPAGATGNANVQTAFGLAYSNLWVNQGTYYSYAFTNTSISNADNDDVMAYCQTSTGGAYFALPTTSFLIGGDNLAFSYTNSLITFYYVYSSAPTITVNFKVVVIPPGLRTNPNVNIKDYESVKKALDLKD